MLGKALGVLRTQYIGVLALFIALGGTSYAAVKIAPGSVGSREIRNGGVKKADIGANAVTASKIANGAVNSDDVADGSLLAGDFKTGQLPKGATGDRGPQGPRGEAGAPGTPGTNGTNGSPDTAQQVLDKTKTVDGDGSGLDADTLDGLSSTAFTRGNATVASGAAARLASADDVVVLSQAGMTVRMDCVLNTSVRLEIVNSTGSNVSAQMDDGSATQAGALLNPGSVLQSRVENQSRTAGRGVLVHFVVFDQPQGQIEFTAAAQWDAGFCRANAVSIIAG